MTETLFTDMLYLVYLADFPGILEKLFVNQFWACCIRFYSVLIKLANQFSTCYSAKFNWIHSEKFCNEKLLINQ